MKKVAVVLSGCGHLDGAEIRESVCALLALDRADADVSIFAPNQMQHHVVNHLNGEGTEEARNVLVEAARIARGDIKPLSDAKADDFDALVLPGGFGAAKNLSDVAFNGPNAVVNEGLKTLIQAFYQQQKPIGAICIAPAVLVASLSELCTPLVTLGDAENLELIEGLGGKHVACETSEVVVDEANRLVSCSAYMRDDRLKHVAAGIEKLVAKLLGMAA